MNLLDLKDKAELYRDNSPFDPDFIDKVLELIDEMIELEDL